MDLNITRVSHDMVRLTVAGLDIMVWPDRHSGAPVVQIDTPELDENSNGPKMRLNLNDHTYLDNDGSQEIEDNCKLCNAGVEEHGLATQLRTDYIDTPVADLQPGDMVDMEPVFEYLFYLDYMVDPGDWDSSKYELWQMADPALGAALPGMAVMHFENNNSYSVPDDIKVRVLNQSSI